jgi:glycogen(starch) synthase
MRVCFLSRRFFPAISGMSAYALNLLRELVADGHEVTMISQYRGDETGVRVYGGGAPPPIAGVKVIGLESHGEQAGGDFEADVAAMVDCVAREHAVQPFDIIHAQYGYPTGFAALTASKQLGVPCVVSIQGGDGHWVGLCCATHKRAMAAVLNHADALLIGSRSFAEEVQQNHGTPLDRFTIVPGAVDVQRFSPREIAGEIRGPLRVLYHGRVDVRKGVMDLLEAWRQVPAGARLAISGIGPDMGAVASKITELGLSASVEQTGYVAYEDVHKVYRSADIFVSPTYAEGFSNTILEAMASGLPVVSTYAVGVVDCIRNDENGLLVEPGDVSGLGRALTRMTTEPALRERLATTALREAREIYSWRTVSQLIVRVYQRLRGTEPDAAWQCDATVTPCRFRAAPHLL